MLKLSNFSILDSCNDTCHLRILESLYINKLRPQLNDYQLAETPLYNKGFSTEYRRPNGRPLLSWIWCIRQE